MSTGTAVPALIDQHGKPLNGSVEQKSALPSTLSTPEAWLIEAFGATPVASGAFVTPRTAMGCAAVRCAVQAISEGIGQLPVHVYARSDQSGKERAPDHPAYRLLHDEANDWTPASDFREQLTRDALLWGDGFAFINRIDGRPAELICLNPEAVEATADATTGEPVYVITNGGVRNALPRQNVLHLKAPSLNGIAGDSPVKQAREAIGLAMTLEAHAARLFGNGARPSGIISFPGVLPSEAATKLKATWQAAHSGARSGGTAVMDHGAAWLPLALTSTDAQFLELRKFAIEEIARVFRVPPMLLMDYGRATHANSEEMGRQFVTFTLMRWIKAWEGELRLKLFTPDERATYFPEFLTDDLLRGDLTSRMTAYATAIAARILSPNEARAAENRPPYEGGDVFQNPNTTAGTPNV